MALPQNSFKHGASSKEIEIRQVSEGDHNPLGRAWGSMRAQVDCAHLVHLPLILFAPEINKYSEKIRIRVSEHSKNFYFWVIFYCTKNSENRQNMAFYFI